MKVILSIFVVIVAFCVVETRAQAGRTKPTTDGKANQRPVEPAASPTPVAGDAIPSDDKTTADDGEIIKVNTQLVSIPVRVMDKKGRFIGGLAKENFKVLEDSVEQEVALFSNEHEPFTVALVLDMSYSTTFKIAEIQNAAIAFIDQLRPNDKVMVISFDEEVHMLCAATNDRQEIYRAIKTTKIATGTSLYEAVGQVMNDRFRRIQGRKAVILFTDGVDTTSRRVNDYDNLSDASELDALVYPIRYDTFADVQNMKNGSIIKPQPPIKIPGQSGGMSLPEIFSGVGTPSTKGTTTEEYRKAEEYLDQLAVRTGGRMYEATTLTNLADAYSKIASELREFYSLGYYPREDRVAGKNTSIKVRVDQPNAVVRTREGYLVPKKTKINGR
ncbi:MAG: VWA domain-containing protein [Pyrinomonadaceae bacterium]